MNDRRLSSAQRWFADLDELIRSSFRRVFLTAHRGMLKEQLWLQWVIGIVWISGIVWHSERGCMMIMMLHFLKGEAFFILFPVKNQPRLLESWQDEYVKGLEEEEHQWKSKSLSFFINISSVAA